LFHAGIEASGFQIGLFSYFMIALYVLVLPEAPIVRMVQWVHRHVPAIPLVSRWAPLARIILRASAIALGAALVLLVPIGTPALVASAIILALGTAGVYAVTRERRDRHALAHLGGCLLLAFLARPGVTDVARDYYRFWGGSARRLGDLATATEKYQRAVELAPGHAQSHVSLGNLYQMTGKSDLALREAERAELLDPQSFRGYLLEAIIRDASGEGHGALAAAEKALERKPDERQAFQIASRWRRKLDMPPPQRPSAPSPTEQGDDEDDE
jgi:tetratricopeptide (TPR) repeat protein